MEFECQNLSKSYQARNGTVYALDDVNFSVGKREFICVVGPSGCGKTTLLKIIAGLQKPTRGQVKFNNLRANGLPYCALVFQNHGLFPWMKVIDNVAFGLEMMNVSRQERRDRASCFIERIGLADFAHSYPHELSMGMCQRVGIARAFVSDPPLLLMDEPFGSLDAQTKRVLQEELLRIWSEHKKMVVHITHDIDEAVLLADRILVMTGRPGSVREDIPIAMTRPRGQAAHERKDIEELKKYIWKLLKDEVQNNLSIAP